MAGYLLHHRHEPDECGVVLTSFIGHDSPLRHRPTLASCRTGGHASWWTIDADSEEGALRLLPFYVAARTPSPASATFESHDSGTETVSAHFGHQGWGENRHEEGKK